jgi:hypothetical protein
METKRQVDDFLDAKGRFDARHSRPHLPGQRGADRHEDDGDTRKDLAAVLNGKLERRGHHRNDEIQLLAGIPASERLREVLLVIRLVEPRVLEIDDRKVHGPWKESPKR